MSKPKNKVSDDRARFEHRRHCEDWPFDECPTPERHACIWDDPECRKARG